MTRRTMMKKMRMFDFGKSDTGRPTLIRRTTPRDPQPRTAMEIDCATVGYPEIGKITTMVELGQMINPKRICKNASKKK